MNIRRLLERQRKATYGWLFICLVFDQQKTRYYVPRLLGNCFMGLQAYNAILKEAWAIQPETLETMLSIAAREHEYADGNLEALEKKLGRPLGNTERAYTRDGVAVIPVQGAMFRGANIFTQVSGATSYEMLAKDLQAANDDPSVTSILLKIDSPGGQVNGISQLAEYIRDSPKPVDAFFDGTGASAAYWMASAARRIVATDTALIGSIGVQMALTVRDAPQGVKSLNFVSSQSPLKNADPTTDAGAAEVQRTVDGLGQVFVDGVAKYRGIDSATVLEKYGQGAVFVAKEALDRGMIDGINTFEAFLSSLTSEASQMDYSKLTATDLRTHRADLVAAIEAGVQKPDVEAAKAEAVKGERDRIAAIQALAMDGCEDVVAACIKDGTSAGEAAQKIIAHAKANPAKPAAPAAPAAANAALDVIKQTEATNTAPAAGHEPDKTADPIAAMVAEARQNGVLR